MQTPTAEIRTRLEALRRALRRARLGGLLLTRTEDIRYVSGFTGTDATLVVTRGRVCLVTDGRFTEEAEASAPLAETVLWTKGLYSHTGELIRRMRLRRVGYAPETLSVAAFETVRSGAGGVSFRQAGEIAAKLRAVKSPWEIRRIRRAVRCAEEAFEAVRGRVRPGMTEADLRLDLEWEMRRRGAEDVAFETIVAAGSNASLPHAHAGRRKLRTGGMVLVDWGARVGGYASDLTRVLFLGSIPPLWRRRYGHLLAAQQAAIDAVGPGVTGRESDAAAREYLAREGLAERFAHGLGHGLGLAVHEGPRLSPRDERTLRPGNVVTVEPGLYFPGRGGLRLEDDVLVTQTGRTVLSRLPRDLEWAVVG